MENFKIIYTYLLRNQKKETGIFLGAALLLTALQAPLPYLSGYIVDSVLPQGEFAQLAMCTGLMAVFYLAFLLVDFLNNRYRLKVREAIMVNLNEKVMRSILWMPRQQRLKLRNGDLTSRLTRDVVELELIMPYGWADLAHKILLCIAVLSVTFYLNWKLSSILFSLVPIGVIVYMRYDALLWQTSHAETKTSANKLVAIQEAVEADEEASAYQAEDFFHNYAGQRIRLFERSCYNRELIDAKIGAIAIGIPMLAMALIWQLGGTMVMSQEITLGFIITYTASLTMIVPAMIQIIEFVSATPNEIVALRRLESLFETHYKTGPKTTKPVETDIKEIATRDIHFAYSGETTLFRGLSVAFTPGELQLISGANGAGKSTLLQLLSGILAPDQGSVRVNGHNTALLDNRSEWITYVPQNIRLFSDSIKLNVTLGESILDEQVIDAIRTMGLGEWLDQQPDGIEHMLNNSNQQLSGGQIQKIGLARALVRQSPVLLLDEPTNNLDSQAVANLLKLLVEYKQSKIIIVVSHDERLTQIADRIVHLETTGHDQGTQFEDRRPHGQTLDRYRAI